MTCPRKTRPTHWPTTLEAVRREIEAVASIVNWNADCLASVISGDTEIEGVSTDGVTETIIETVDTSGLATKEEVEDAELFALMVRGKGC